MFLNLIIMILSFRNKDFPDAINSSTEDAVAASSNSIIIILFVILQYLASSTTHMQFYTESVTIMLGIFVSNTLLVAHPIFQRWRKAYRLINAQADTWKIRYQAKSLANFFVDGRKREKRVTAIHVLNGVSGVDVSDKMVASIEIERSTKPLK
eukprot:jgi/Hompol1/1799/HPOL_005725-RA